MAGFINPKVAMAVMGTGIVMSTQQQYQQGKEQRKLYEQRATAAEADAAAIAKATEYESREKRKEGTRFKARQKALFAKAGVRITGTPLLVMKETARAFERDAAFITEGGMVEARRLRSQAGFERDIGKSLYKAGKWGAGTTLLTGAGTIGMLGYKSGMWGGGTTKSSTGRGTMAWSGYKEPKRRTTFRGL